MAHETATLAAYVADLKFEDIPGHVLDRAKVLTLDFLGRAYLAIIMPFHRLVVRSLLRQVTA